MKMLTLIASCSLLATAAFAEDNLRIVHAANQLGITNIGKQTITIKDIEINNRPECKVLDMINTRANLESDGLGWKKDGITLRVGEGYVWISDCSPIIRVMATTDHGREYFN